MQPETAAEVFHGIESEFLLDKKHLSRAYAEKATATLRT